MGFHQQLFPGQPKGGAPSRSEEALCEWCGLAKWGIAHRVLKREPKRGSLDFDLSFPRLNWGHEVVRLLVGPITT